MRTRRNLAMLLTYLGASAAASLVPETIVRSAQSTPHASSRPTLTRGKRQMSQKHRANRRKASVKARRR